MRTTVKDTLHQFTGSNISMIRGLFLFGFILFVTGIALIGLGVALSKLTSGTETAYAGISLVGMFLMVPSLFTGEYRL